MSIGDEQAYPFLEKVEQVGELMKAHGGKGMTYRQYLIARAPAVIPEWFKAEVGPEPTAPKMEDYCRSTFELASLQRASSNSEMFTASPLYAQAMAEHGQAFRQYEEKKRHLRPIQWPIYWANRVIHELEKEKADES